jgi:hypothetical protein
MPPPKHYGPLLWQAPRPKPLPRPVLYLSALAMFGLGAVFVWPVWIFIENLSFFDPATWVLGGGVSFFFLFGLWILYCADFYQVPEGMLFYRNGLELGEGEERRFLNYNELERFELGPGKMSFGEVHVKPRNASLMTFPLTQNEYDALKSIFHSY